jgi:hypothetical protein
MYEGSYTATALQVFKVFTGITLRFPGTRTSELVAKLTLVHI